ncbi:sulfotransferase family protein [Mastigocoleus testarum]|nr:sulfotransferase [Mastigocoleus testarum]
MKNPVIFGFQRKLVNICNPIKVIKNIQWRYGSTTSVEPHVFVVGAPRSGTTLMFSVLASHPAFSFIERETFFFVPRNVLDLECYTRLSNFGGPTKQEIKDIFKASSNLVELYDNVADLIKQRDRKQRFLEKTPFHVLYLKFLINHFPNAKFIHMIRDGRDCYLSSKRLAAHYHKPLSKEATLWCDSIKARQSLGESRQIIDIRYEEFTHKPLEITQKIMNFLGEDFLEEQVKTTSYSKTKMFAGESGHERLKQPIKPSSIGQWREKMTSEEINLFQNIAGSQLKQFNYEVI